MSNTSITRRSVLTGAVALVAGTAVTVSAPLPVKAWSFDVGQLVSHADQPMLAVVVSRVRSSKGREIIGVRRLADVQVIDLMILAESLVCVPIHEAEAVLAAEAAWRAL